MVQMLKMLPIAENTLSHFGSFRSQTCTSPSVPPVTARVFDSKLIELILLNILGPFVCVLGGIMSTNGFPFEEDRLSLEGVHPPITVTGTRCAVVRYLVVSPRHRDLIFSRFSCSS